MNLANLGIIFAHKDKKVIKEFKKQFATVMNVEIVRCPLLQIPTADCLVCPGNSYGMMEASESKSITILLKEIKNHIKNVIDNAYYGEQPVGTSIIINTNNKHYKMMAYVPISRYNPDISNTINPYIAFRSLLSTVLNHNKVSDNKIHTILCPPFGLEHGISPEESSRQMRLAYGFVDIGLGCSEDNARMIDGLLN